MADDHTPEDSNSSYPDTDSSVIMEQTFHVLLVERTGGEPTSVERLLGEACGAMLVRYGLFEVTQVECMSDALAEFNRTRFSVVLLDLQLPGEGGLNALQQVRAVASETPVIVLTNVNDDGMALRAIAAGAQDFLPKDQLDTRLLARTIISAVERNRAETQLRRRAHDLEMAHAQIKCQAAELERRNDELDRINHELEEFTYIASHDLKEPLRGISAYCEMLKEDYEAILDNEGQRRLDKMGDLCRRLESLIADLLTYCRVGSVKPAVETVDLNVVVGDICDLLRPAVEDRSAVVHVYGPLPRVSGDTMLLGLAMANLISNGLKFNRSEHPTVEIGVVPSPQPTVYVRDNGIGIEPQHHDAIFAMFRRLHGRQEYEGSGAGLTIVRKIVESLGGRVWLESEPGKGAAFYLALPPAIATVALAPPHWTKAPNRCEIPSQ